MDVFLQGGDIFGEHIGKLFLHGSSTVNFSKVQASVREKVIFKIKDGLL